MSRHGDFVSRWRYQHEPEAPKKRRPWEAGAGPVLTFFDGVGIEEHFASSVSRICVEFHDRTPAPPAAGHWTWEQEYEAAESAILVGVSACRRRERPFVLTMEEWVEAHLDGSVRPIVVDFEHPVEPGRYVVLAKMWGSTDYWGEHDEGIDVIEIRSSPGNCETYWRRRAHERRAARAARRT